MIGSSGGRGRGHPRSDSWHALPPRTAEPAERPPLDAITDDTRFRDRLRNTLIDWYERNARDLPWRAADRTPWGVLVSEIMLQQTPVARVLPVWRMWMHRWPTPATLAAAEPGTAIRAWDRLGYPGRALRLHATAALIVERHGGGVPSDYDELCSLPGVGDYTAAAVASFGFGQRHAVLDTNVRRVLARVVNGVASPPSTPTAAERRLVLSLLPHDGAAPAWSVAMMELGALVCTTRSPRCEKCPVAASCLWRRAGYPAGGPVGRVQRFAGTDRQARGRLMAVVRESPGAVSHRRLGEAWPQNPAQRDRALDALVADGLVEPLAGGRYRLPARGRQVHAHELTPATDAPPEGSPPLASPGEYVHHQAYRPGDVRPGVVNVVIPEG